MPVPVAPGGPYTKFRLAQWSRFAQDVLKQYPGSCIISQNPLDVSVHPALRGGDVCVRIFGDLEGWQAFAKDFDGVIGASECPHP